MSRGTVAVSGGNITVKIYGNDNYGIPYVLHSIVRPKVAADDNLTLGKLPASLSETSLSNDW